MNRPTRLLLTTCASVAMAAFAAACGTERITVPRSDPAAYHGAVLFSQRCSGCHTLAYAATHGSAANVRTREITNGPNFNVRCERPIDRVLYAIENGGFSGAIMPQNIVVGADARQVAQFVATYAGRQAPQQPGGIACDKQPVGSLPSATATTPSAPTTTVATTPTAVTQVPTKAKAKGKGKSKTKTKARSKTKARARPKTRGAKPRTRGAAKHKKKTTTGR